MQSSPNALSKTARREKVALAYAMVEASLSETYFERGAVEREVSRAMTVLRGVVRNDLRRVRQTGDYKVAA